MEQERMQILKMVEAGTIRADEAARLLEAFEAAPGVERAGGGRQARWIRVRVYDLKTGRTKVSANIPINLLNVALKLAPKLAPKGVFRVDGQQIDLEELGRALQEGVEGKLVAVNDDDQGVRVEVSVE